MTMPMFLAVIGTTAVIAALAGLAGTTSIVRRGRATSWLAAALACAGLAPTPAGATPWRPKDDDQLVLRLPQRITAGDREQRRALAQQPQDLGLALAIAHAALARAARSGDPRELGQAQAALTPWWSLSDPPAPVRLLRARVWQSQHRFDDALADLRALTSGAAGPSAAPVPPLDGPRRVAYATATSRAPDLSLQAQARWDLAAVLRVTGRLDLADEACRALLEPRYAALGETLAVRARACRAELLSLRGDAPGAHRALQALALEAPDDPWLALVRAELAERQGQVREAGALYRRALGLGARTRRLPDEADVYSLTAYADWWLAQGRPDEALHWLEQGDPQADALMVRRAIAWSRLAEQGTAAASETAKPVRPLDAGRTRITATDARQRAQAIAQALDERQRDAQWRGENVHQREQARLALEVRGDAKQALALAIENWRHQKEPADALLLARCAHAARQPDAAREIQERVKAGWADVRLPRDVQPH
jgi:hypothetical protein